MNEKRIRYKRSKKRYYFEIEGFSMEDEIDMNLLINFIRDISRGKYLFVETYDGSMSSMKDDVVLHSYEEKKRFFIKRGKFQINPEKVDSENKIFESRCTFFYITEQTMKWNDFLEMDKIWIDQLFKEKVLLSTLSFGDTGYPEVILVESYEYHMRNLFEKFQENQYLVKKRLF